MGAVSKPSSQNIPLSILHLSLYSPERAGCGLLGELDWNPPSASPHSRFLPYPSLYISPLPPFLLARSGYMRVMGGTRNALVVGELARELTASRWGLWGVLVWWGLSVSSSIGLEALQK